MCDEPEFDEDNSRLILGPIRMQRWIYSCSKQLLDRVIWAYGQQGRPEVHALPPVQLDRPAARQPQLRPHRQLARHHAADPQPGRGHAHPADRRRRAETLLHRRLRRRRRPVPDHREQGRQLRRPDHQHRQPGQRGQHQGTGRDAGGEVRAASAAVASSRRSRASARSRAARTTAPAIRTCSTASRASRTPGSCSAGSRRSRSKQSVEQTLDFFLREAVDGDRRSNGWN